MGIQEHIYTISEYFSAGRKARFIPKVTPMPSLLRDPGRNWPRLRRVGLWLLKSGAGNTAFFERFLYPLMLQFYPRVPFPHFALVLEKKP